MLCLVDVSGGFHLFRNVRTRSYGEIQVSFLACFREKGMHVGVSCTVRPKLEHVGATERGYVRRRQCN